MTALLEVADLIIRYDTLQAVRGASLVARAGEVIGIVGEPGCGKSTLAAALIALPQPGARITGGAVRLHGRDLTAMTEEEKRAVRGRHIAMIFQDPMTSFNPVLTIGEQLVDFQGQREGLSRAEKREQAATMLKKVGIADPARCLDRHVHELSGGMRQRAAIAAALLMAPDVLVADEPTTALDVTMEAQIIHLLRELRRDYNGAIVIVTHHLGVVGELCDRVYVMYAGEVVEEGSTDDVYHRPRHPYTRALIACDPANLHDQTPVLPTIPGRLPDLVRPPSGCSFAARCPQASERCRSMVPPYVEVGPRHAARCHEALP
jgi:oligopeptide/dipeptide ABC transporter ATP-binding protein